MKSIALIFLIALCGCNAVPVVKESLTPPLPPELPSNPRQFKSITVTPHANPNEQPRPAVPIKYPAGINPNDYRWTVQFSSDMRTWRDLPGSALTGTFDLPQLNKPVGFYRMKGVPK